MIIFNSVELSVRAANAIHNYFYATAGLSWAAVEALPMQRLADVDFRDLARTKNLGKRSLAEICDALALHGFQSKNCPHCTKTMTAKGWRSTKSWVINLCLSLRDAAVCQIATARASTGHDREGDRMAAVGSSSKKVDTTDRSE